jgi:hypothetical protein
MLTIYKFIINNSPPTSTAISKLQMRVLRKVLGTFDFNLHYGPSMIATVSNLITVVETLIM